MMNQRFLLIALLAMLNSAQISGQIDSIMVLDSTKNIVLDTFSFDLDENEEVFLIVEKKPEFPGCERIENDRERSTCANNAMLAFVYDNIVYPPEARAAKISGFCVVQYVVNKKGEVKNIELVRDIGYGCGDEAVRVIKEMAYQGKIWSPGTQRGIPVNVKITLPLKFKLTP